MIAPIVRPRRNVAVVRSSSPPLMPCAPTGRGSPRPTTIADPDPGHDRRREQVEVADHQDVEAEAVGERVAGPRAEDRGEHDDGRRPPAVPRMSTYSEAWKMPTRMARMSAGLRLTRRI